MKNETSKTIFWKVSEVYEQIEKLNIKKNQDETHKIEINFANCHVISSFLNVQQSNN